jgi:hypothetical protein
MQTLIPSRWKTPELFTKRLGEKVGRQRLMTAEGNLLLVLHGLPDPKKEERDAVLLWRNPKGEWQSSLGGAGIADLIEHVASYDRAADKLDSQLRATPTADGYFAVLHEATPLLRAARNLAAVLQQAREAESNDRHILLARDEAVEIERHLELLHSEALQGLQYLAASRAEESAKQGEKLVACSHRLNLLMALCLPATALASVLGMNVRHGLENQDPLVFWIVLGVAIALGVVILGLVSAPVRSQRPNK